MHDVIESDGGHYMANHLYSRFSAWLWEAQLFWLRREAARRGVSENAVLRGMLDFALATRGTDYRWNGLTVEETELPDDLASLGYVLAKIADDKFTVRVGPFFFEMNRRKAFSRKQVAEFLRILKTGSEPGCTRGPAKEDRVGVD